MIDNNWEQLVLGLGYQYLNPKIVAVYDNIALKAPFKRVQCGSSFRFKADIPFQKEKNCQVQTNQKVNRQKQETIIVRRFNIY